MNSRSSEIADEPVDIPPLPVVKGKKKSLSKYGAFNQSISRSGNNDSDEDDYGKLEPEEPVVTKKILKKSLSKYGSHSIEKIVTPSGDDSDEDYGKVDPSFKPDKVAVTSKGELVAIPENSTPKVMKKTLSKYGTPSTIKTPVSVRSADSDDDYGVLESSNGHGKKKIKKTLSKYSKDTNGHVEARLAFEDLKIDSDEDEYGPVDSSFQPERVAKTSSGALVVPPDPTKKTMKKTLSKYGNSPAQAQTDKQQQAKSVLSGKGEDSDEEYGAVDPSFLDSSKASYRKSLKSRSSEDPNDEKRADENSTLSPVKAMVAKIEALKASREGSKTSTSTPNRSVVASRESYDDRQAASTDSLDMSLNALKVDEGHSSTANSRPVSRDVSFHSQSREIPLKGLQSNSLDLSDPGLSHEDKLIALIGKGYTRDQAEEYLAMVAPQRPADSTNRSFTQPRSVETTPQSQVNHGPPPRVPSTGSGLRSGSGSFTTMQQQMMHQPYRTTTPEQRQIGIDELIARGYTPEQATAIFESRSFFRSTSGEQLAPTTATSGYGYYYPYYPYMSPPATQTPTNPPLRYNPYMPHSPLNFVQDKDDQAMKIAMLVSEQEAEFGVNMYQVITEADEPEIQKLVERGFTVDEAIFWLFEKQGYRLKKHQHLSQFPTMVTSPPEGAGVSQDERSESTLTKSIISESPARSSMRDVTVEELDPSEREEQKSTGLSPIHKKKVEQRKKSAEKAKSLFGFSFSSAEKHHHHHQPAAEDKHHSTSSHHKRRPSSTSSSLFRSNSNSNLATDEEKEIKKALKYREKDVKIITELGFSRDQAVQALIENDHNVSVATNVLLSSVRESENLRRSRSSGSYSQGSVSRSGSSHNLPVPMMMAGPPGYPMMYYPPAPYYPGMAMPPAPPNSASYSTSQYGGGMMMYPMVPPNSYSYPNSREQSFYGYSSGIPMSTGNGDQQPLHVNPNSASFYDYVPQDPTAINRVLSSSNDSHPAEGRRGVKSMSSSNSAVLHRSSSSNQPSPHRQPHHHQQHHQTHVSH